MKRLLLLIITVFYAISIFAQAAASETVEMADTMRSNGKIYVVVSVILVLFLVLFIYLISVERKLSRLEKELKK